MPGHVAAPALPVLHDLPQFIGSIVASVIGALVFGFIDSQQGGVDPLLPPRGLGRILAVVAVALLFYALTVADAVTAKRQPPRCPDGTRGVVARPASTPVVVCP